MYVYLREVSVRVFPAPPVVYLTLTVTVPGRCAGVVTLTLLPSPRIRFVPGLVSKVRLVITGCRLNDTGEGTRLCFPALGLPSWPYQFCPQVYAFPSLPTASEYPVRSPYTYPPPLTWLNLMPLLVAGGVMVVDSLPSWLPLSGLILQEVLGFLLVHLAVRVRFWVTGLLKS